MEGKKEINKILTFFKNNKVQTIIVLILLFMTIFLSTQMRMLTLPNLIDETTNDYAPLALDPYYFLRVSETIMENNGSLPEVDEFRYIPGKVPWTNQILPFTTVWIYKTINFFGSEQSLNYAAVINPVVFFILGLIAFFFLIYFLTKNKWISLIASMILSVIPPYLYRTLVGFADHDSIGMFGFYLAILIFSLGLFYQDRTKKKWYLSGGLGLLSGLSILFALTSWDGAAKFLFMMLPLAFLVSWLTNEDSNDWNAILFYGTFIISSLVFAPIFSYTAIGVLKSNMLSMTGILTLFALGYSIISLIIREAKFIPKKIKEKPILYSSISIFVLAAIFYQLVIGHLFSFLGNLMHSLLYPFGTGRVGLTVAENAQPYLETLISQIGSWIFYIFLFGCFLVGLKLSNGIQNKKYRPYFTASYAFFVFGILFSRISSTSVLNGENFISKALFFVSFLVFVVSTIYIYSKSKWELNTNWIIIASWMIPILIATRSASRVLFLIVPFVSLIIPWAIFEVFSWGRKNKDKSVKKLIYVMGIVMSVILLINLNGYYQSDKLQAGYQTLSYNSDWQNAMSWVRENTPEDSVFLHWWDYGYWVQTGGNRNSIADGGFHPDFIVHNIGRYVLTTPYPETAKSYAKTMDADYLLIDPTDIGKYSAYSSIADDNEVSDRSSYLATFTSNPEQITETRNGTTRVYQGGIYLDTDVIYENETIKLFLPKGKAAILGIIFEINSQSKPNQPIGVYLYNNKQYYLPIKNLYIEDTFVDFKEGIDATAYIYPLVYVSGNTQKVDEYGSAMYLSEKTQNSLVAQLYLMNDVNNLYPEFELVKEQTQYPFSFYYNGYQGSIKIYKINKDEMTNILVREEFLEEWESNDNLRYGSLDNLEFIKN